MWKTNWNIQALVMPLYVYTVQLLKKQQRQQIHSTNYSKRQKILYVVEVWVGVITWIH